MRLLANPFWGLDQYALFRAYLAIQPSLALFGPEVADVEGVSGLFSFTAGKSKATLADDDTPYAKLFRRYSSQVAG